MFKRQIPIAIAMLTGFIMVAAYFSPPLEGIGGLVESWFLVLAAMAMVLGGVNLCMHHLTLITNLKPGWAYSAITLTGFLVTLLVGLVKLGVPLSEQYPKHPWANSYEESPGAIWWLYEYIIQPSTSTMFALLSFFVASAAFRAFRAKTTEAALLLGTALIVLLGRSYAGTVLSAPLGDTYSFASLTDFVIMSVINTSGQRAIVIGIALGIAATSLRILLGMDRSYLGADE
jgi:hypothetical protein